jgi:hypothetical protein
MSKNKNDKYKTHVISGPGGCIVAAGLTKDIAKEILKYYESIGKTGYYIRPAEEWMRDVFFDTVTLSD